MAMNQADILRLFDEQERKNVTHPAYRRETAEGVVRHIHPALARLSFILYSELTAANADRIIDRQIAWYDGQVNGGGLEWSVYDHDRPPDLAERLAAHGFAAGEREGLLLLDLHQPPAEFRPLLEAGPGELEARGVAVRRVTDPDEFGQVAAIQATVYGANFDWLEKQLRQDAAAEPGYWAIYLVTSAGVPVCAAWISFPAGSQFAGLFGGATLPACRGQGLYTAVVAARAQEALRRGRRFLTVDANDNSRPILLRRGFRLLTCRRPYLWKKSAYG
jgi:GNAT superfamily N-acetyltransferase